MVECKIIHDTGVTMFKYLTNLYPDHLLTFPTVGDITGSTTRQRDHLYIPKTNTELGVKFLSVRSPKSWNSLPSIVKEATTLPSFKTKLKIKFLDENIL